MLPVPICTTNIAKTATTRVTGSGSNRTSVVLPDSGGGGGGSGGDSEEETTDLENTSNDNLDGILNIMVNPQCNGGVEGVDDAKLQHLLDVLENLGTDVPPEENSNKLNEDDGGAVSISKHSQSNRIHLFFISFPPLLHEVFVYKVVFSENGTRLCALTFNAAYPQGFLCKSVHYLIAYNITWFSDGKDSVILLGS